MNYKLDTEIEFREGKKTILAGGIKDSNDKWLGHLNVLFLYLSYRPEEKIKEYLDPINKVLNEESEQETIGQDDVYAEIKKDLTVITNDNFDDSPSDIIPTIELKRLFEEWWKEYTAFLNKEGKPVPSR
jgi:hypothetical protein